MSGWRVHGCRFWINLFIIGCAGIGIILWDFVGHLDSHDPLCAFADCGTDSLLACSYSMPASSKSTHPVSSCNHFCMQAGLSSSSKPARSAGMTYRKTTNCPSPTQSVFRLRSQQGQEEKLPPPPLSLSPAVFGSDRCEGASGDKEGRNVRERSNGSKEGG
mmetsp:Transcript_27091/g.53179  ORF Transcript_27091/g.53179 Transcript_27091/m.53179 type:complete len:161 (+) Transcript_27091:147-629(+)